MTEKDDNKFYVGENQAGPSKERWIEGELKLQAGSHYTSRTADPTEDDAASAGAAYIFKWPFDIHVEDFFTAGVQIKRDDGLEVRVYAPFDEQKLDEYYTHAINPEAVPLETSPSSG